MLQNPPVKEQRRRGGVGAAPHLTLRAATAITRLRGAGAGGKIDFRESAGRNRKGRRQSERPRSREAEYCRKKNPSAEGRSLLVSSVSYWEGAG